MKKYTSSHDPNFFKELMTYYYKFLSRSPQYQADMEDHRLSMLENEREMFCKLEEAGIKIVPAKISPGKKRKAIRPEELKKPYLFSSGSINGQIAWDITNKFSCDSNRVILEINIEGPIDEIEKQVKAIISRTQEDYWKKHENENWYGEYRYLVDYKKIKKGKNFVNKPYPFVLWETYITAYDLSQQDPPLKNREIGKILFPDYDIDDAKTKATQAVEAAKRLITAAEENKFPP